MMIARNGHLAIPPVKLSCESLVSSKLDVEVVSSAFQLEADCSDVLLVCHEPPTSIIRTWVKKTTLLMHVILYVTLVMPLCIH